MPSELSSTAENYWLAGGRKGIPHLTDAALRFAAEHSRLLDFHLFYASAVEHQFNSRDGKETNELKDLMAQLVSNTGLITEVVIGRVVDNFLCYITDLLALIYKQRPEMLRSSEQERIDFILQYDSMDELRFALAEKRVERLAYLGLRDLAEHLSAQMNFDLFAEKHQLTHAALLVEYRNLLVHNRGIVSSTSVKRFPVLSEQKGKRLSLSPQIVRDYRKFLENAVFDIDLRAAVKYSLPVIPIPEPPERLID